MPPTLKGEMKKDYSSMVPEHYKISNINVTSRI